MRLINRYSVIGALLLSLGVTAAVYSADNATLGGAAAASLGAVTNAGTFATQITGSALTSLQLIDDAISGTGVNVSQVNGVTPLMGAGNTGTGSNRVTEATDSQLSAGVGATGDAAATAGSTGSVNAKLRLSTTLLDSINTAIASLLTSSQLIDDDQTGGTTCMLISTAATNSTNCKASAGRVLAIRAVNTTSTLGYVRMYNTASAPTCSSATGFIESIPVPHGTGTGNGISFTNGPAGQAYATGISFCITGGGSSTDNTNAVAAIYLTVIYK